MLSKRIACLNKKISTILSLFVVIILVFAIQHYNLESITTNNKNTTPDLVNKKDSEPNNEEPINESQDNKAYHVYWPIHKKTLTINENNQFFVDKKESFNAEIKVPQDNLKSISFELSWEDDITTPLFHFGKDTLTFSIKSPNNKEIYKTKTIGKAEISYTHEEINKKPTITTIEAKNESDAYTKLKEYYNSNWKDEPIKLKVDLKIGEIRILRRLIEKGNYFKLKISYEYYDPEITTEKDNPPDTNIQSGPMGTINYKTVEFSWAGFDDFTPVEKLSYSYKLLELDNDWSLWTTERSVVYNDLSEGNYTFFVRAKDHRDNIDPLPANRSFKIDLNEGNQDNTSPDTSVISGPSGIVNYNTVMFTWTGTDDITSTEDLVYSYMLEGYDSSWSSFSSSTSKNYNNLDDSSYTFKVKAKDAAGNVDSTPAQRSFTIYTGGSDVTPPDTSITSGPSGTINYDTVTFTWTGTDDTTSTPDLKYSYKLEGYDSSWSSYSSSTSNTYNDLDDGSYTFKVRAKDAAGNVDPTQAERSFTVDTENPDITPPDTSITSGPSGTIDYNDVTFTWTGSDDTTPTSDLTYSYKLEGYDSSWSSYSSSISKSYNDLDDGSYTFNVRAKDAAGNVDPTPAIRTFTVAAGEPDRFATTVVELNFGEDHHPGYADPTKALGGPRGEGDYMGSLHVLSLGKNGDITFGFDVTIKNGPGYDFIVFENPFYIYSQPGKVFAELMYVEVSSDGTNFARFPSISNTPGPGAVDPDDVTNLAGVWPVYANVDENDIDPCDPAVAGGDAFDLNDLLNHPLVQSGDVDLQNINYIKLIDIVGDGSCLDSQGNPIYDPTDMDNGADIDAISVINYT
jgi:hypothetical protein